MNSESPAIVSNAAGGYLRSVTHSRRFVSAANATTHSTNIRLCVILIYYFSLCDFALKFFPLRVAIVLRYLPEVVLYSLVLLLLSQKVRIRSFPLLWPLCACAGTMILSGLLNRSSPFDVVDNFRIFFRFAAFAYILWRTNITPRRIEQLVNGFLGLTVTELLIGALQRLGGKPAQDFFSPALGWESGQTFVWQNPIATSSVWLNGTFSNNNHFGFFMVISCILASTMYFTKGSRRYLWITLASALGVFLSYSRHSMALMILGVGLLFFLHRKRLAMSFGVLRTALTGIGICLLAVLSVAFSSSLQARVASGLSLEVLTGDPNENMRLFMTLELAPRFLNTYPYFGQGPVPPGQAENPDKKSNADGPILKAAPDMPGWVTYFLSDVVWLLVLGFYGCAGLVAFGTVFASMIVTARTVARVGRDPASVNLAHACVVLVVLFALSGYFSEEIIARDVIPIFWTVAGTVMSLAAKPLSLGKGRIWSHSRERSWSLPL